MFCGAAFLLFVLLFTVYAKNMRQKSNALAQMPQPAVNQKLRGWRCPGLIKKHTALDAIEGSKANAINFAKREESLIRLARKYRL